MTIPSKYVLKDSELNSWKVEVDTASPVALLMMPTDTNVVCLQ